MKNYFSISEAAKEANTTTETLRHYDRIGLVNPSKKDEFTKYRYYTKQDIVRLNTVRALQQMDLPLQEIKQILDLNDLQKIVDYLTEAEKKADAKIAALQYCKAKIMLAKSNYMEKIYNQSINEDIFIQEIPKRTIMLSSLEYPTLENLWNYHRHFYDKLDPTIKEQFTFEDIAGIYTEKGHSQMFTVCSQYIEIDKLKTLPAGKYLCIECAEEDKEEKQKKLIQTAKEKYHIEPDFLVEIIVITGVLKWKYQLQVVIEPELI